VYGGIFAFLSVGFIGGSQLNIYLNKKFRGEKIFRIALRTQLIASLIFVGGVLSGLMGFYTTIAMLFVCLSCIGIINPNANALALAPFTKNVGSASALLGFLQIGVAGLASSGVGVFSSTDTLVVAGLMLATCSVAFIVLMIGLKRIAGKMVTANAPGTAAH
jgi:MFS transporter, DHA1 family, multidrug resistance protein